MKKTNRKKSEANTKPKTIKTDSQEKESEHHQSKKKMPKSKKLFIAGICLFLAGVCVFFYPGVAKFFTSLEQSAVIDDFNKNLAVMPKIEYPTDPDGDGENEFSDEPLLDKDKADQNREYDPKLLARLYGEMVKYNKELFASGQQLLDPFSYQQSSFNLTEYSVFDNVFGYITAPTINLDMPIYLGASADNMWNGAAHMTGTSLPIGGKNTNAVLATHRGVINKTMFDNIVFLNEGDSVFITNLWYKMEYKVVKTEVILPSESDKVKIQPGKDMLTLLTCHPYGYSDYRYVVYCERA